MRLALVFALSSLLASGCLSMVIPEHPGPDAGTHEMTGSDGSASPDLGTGSDGGSQNGDGGLGAFGAVCTTNADCESGDCATFTAGQFCSQKCTMTGQPDPTCPNDVQCNGNGDCKAH